MQCGEFQHNKLHPADQQILHSLQLWQLKYSHISVAVLTKHAQSQEVPDINPVSNDTTKGIHIVITLHGQT